MLAVATLHYGFNEGAILQAKALCGLLEAGAGVPAQIFDRRYPRKLEAYRQAGLTDRTRELQAAIDTWLPLSAMRFDADVESEGLRYLQENYSGLVVGSDMVWNLRYKRRLRRVLPRGVFCSQPYAFFPAFPNIYWPSQDVGVPRFAYGAAVGTLDWRTVPRRHKREMQRRLSGFRVLSVRDERSLEFLHAIDPASADRAFLVPDPTLAYDLTDTSRLKKLRHRLAEWGVDFGRPLCGIISRDDDAVRSIAASLTAEGFQTVAITTRNRMCELPLFDRPIHPLDWAVLFRLMRVCIVDRMHAAIFCLSNGTPFVVVDRDGTEMGSSSKTRSLMERFELGDFCVRESGLKASRLLACVRAVLDQFPSRQNLGERLKREETRAKLFFSSMGSGHDEA